MKVTVKKEVYLTIEELKISELNLILAAFEGAKSLSDAQIKLQKELIKIYENSNC